MSGDETAHHPPPIFTQLDVAVGGNYVIFYFAFKNNEIRNMLLSLLIVRVLIREPMLFE